MSKTQKNVAQLLFAFGVFLLLYGLGNPKPGFDGRARLIVAEAMWNEHTIPTTWFDFGSIFTQYLCFGPAQLIKDILPTPFNVFDLAFYLHSLVFVVGLLTLLFNECLPLTTYLQQRWKTAVLVACIFANPILFTFERSLIETPLAFYLTVIFLVCERAASRDQRWHFLSFITLMVCAGLAVWTRGPSVLFIAPLAALFLYLKRIYPFLGLSLGTLSGVAGSAWWNWHRSGSLFGYSYGAQTFDANILEGLYAFLCSPGLSIFVFAPLTAFGVRQLYHQIKERRVFDFAVALAMLTWLLLFAAWGSYNGGVSYGPRFLLPVLPILCIYGIRFITAHRHHFKSTGRRLLLGVCLIWSAYIQVFSIVLPEHYFWHDWDLSADPWPMPTREKQIYLEFADHLSMFSPAFVPYFGGMLDLFRRRDLWEIAFVNFKHRTVSSVYRLDPAKDIKNFEILSRGSKNVGWNICEIEVEDAIGRRLEFDAELDARFADPLVAHDQNMATCAESTPLVSGIKIVVNLRELTHGGVKVTLHHGGGSRELPVSTIVQEKNGKYFRGDLNDPSYIKFDKTLVAHNVFDSIDWRQYVPLNLGFLSLLVSIFLLTSKPSSGIRC